MTTQLNSYLVVGAPTPTSREPVETVTVFRFFDNLLDDIVSDILGKLASSADCPADFMVSLLISKRFNGLALKDNVLSKASAEVFAVSAKKWSPSVDRFLNRCIDAGSIEANYMLGMIHYYCFHNWSYGSTLIAKAANESHAPALYSLAIIEFNGSGTLEKPKDVSPAVTLCSRAASLGHIDAIRELAHCLKDGYGITQNVAEAHRLLLDANARESDVLTKAKTKTQTQTESGPTFYSNYLLTRSSMLYEEFPKALTHPANRFLAGWYETRIPRPELDICCYDGCGRPETRMFEFRKCSLCNVVSYCSRACQARDWSMGHFKVCQPRVRFVGV